MCRSNSEPQVLENTLDDNRSDSVNPVFLHLVRRLNDHLAALGNQAIVEEKNLVAWAGYFQALAVTEVEVDQLGAWYAKQYTTAPSIPMLAYYVQHLREHGEFPEHRLISNTERDSGAILQACAELGLDRHSLAEALFQAAALVHNAVYKESIPDADPEFVRNVVEGWVRKASDSSTDILDEVQRGVGQSAYLRKILFPHD